MEKVYRRPPTKRLIQYYRTRVDEPKKYTFDRFSIKQLQEIQGARIRLKWKIKVKFLINKKSFRI